MDVLHHHLEAVETASLGDLDLSGEALCQVFKDNTVTGCEECKNMLDEMLFVLLEALPVLHVCSQINLINSPEACHLILVHFPDVGILDRQEDEAVRVVLKQRLWHRLLGSSVDVAELRCSSHTLRRLNLAACASESCVVLVKELG